MVYVQRYVYRIPDVESRNYLFNRRFEMDRIYKLFVFYWSNTSDDWNKMKGGRQSYTKKKKIK